MKKLIVIALAAIVFAGSAPFALAQDNARKKQGPRQRTSPHETTGAVIDGSRVTVVYGRPYMARGGQGTPRTVWGGELVPYGKIWRFGADEATLLITQHPIEIGGKTVPAGAHSLWLLPKEDGSAQLIVNKQIGQWGINPRNPKSVYDEANDVARVDLKKESLDETVAQFTISVERNPAGGGLFKLAWDKTAYSVPFTVKQ